MTVGDLIKFLEATDPSVKIRIRMFHVNDLGEYYTESVNDVVSVKDAGLGVVEIVGENDERF